LRQCTGIVLQLCMPNILPARISLVILAAEIVVINRNLYCLLAIRNVDILSN